MCVCDSNNSLQKDCVCVLVYVRVQKNCLPMNAFVLWPQSKIAFVKVSKIEMCVCFRIDIKDTTCTFFVRRCAHP